ncbi:ABC transporter substrate-binding protein [Stenotrophomonas sp. CPCC 101365]|uniref:ABC transporter substrate-binding protein n=1 Tax=Stenotrophomonas mori TaxID=2871096 RepID=A0ABT0SI94_9GAMM|nr:ABC transporter substrate-binding protein [Stenotrophomonas mori]
MKTCVIGLVAASIALGAQAGTLRVVPSAPLQILDPLSTTAHITRDHGFMVYDTLFGTDATGAIQPQMVESYSIDAAKTTWTFTLREGLEFHDGSPVTSADVIASLQRWQTLDIMGGKMKERTVRMRADDDRTFRIELSAPFALMLEALGKPSSIVPFIMQKSVVDAAGTGPVTRIVGSGPFRFVQEAFKPGERAIYARNARYRPRGEPASGTAGGKTVRVDAVEWVFLRDPQTAVNALRKKEVDFLDTAPFEQVPDLQKDPGLEVIDRPLSLSYVMRFNAMTPPFNDPRVRRAAMLAMSQEAILKVQVNVPGAFQSCTSVYPCGTTYSSPSAHYTGKPDFAAARRLLEDAGYDGTPVVILDTPEVRAQNKTAAMISALLRLAGFRTRLMPLDWASWLQKRTSMLPPDQGGWSIFVAGWSPLDLTVPLSSAPLTASGRAGWPGWFEDAEVESLLAQFADTQEPARQKAIATLIQERILAQAAIVPLGQASSYSVARRHSLDGLLPRIAATVYWNVSLSDK